MPSVGLKKFRSARSKLKNTAIICALAGIAQLVERNLAKVEVDGSRPFSRSKFEGQHLKNAVLFYSQAPLGKE